MKPMLAAATDGSEVTYPAIASPKLDGVRCLIIDGVAVSRSLKPIPNKHVQHLFGRSELNGLDGELIIGDLAAPDAFQKTSSGVMRIDGTPGVLFFVFDDFALEEGLGFSARLRKVSRRVQKLESVHAVPHSPVLNYENLMELESICVNQGFEGIMIRSPDGLYKHGRSTLNQGWLLKLKRFEDSEARITGYRKLMRNINEAKINNLGYTERSNKSSGKEPQQAIGAFTVKDVTTGIEFDIGTGFTQEQRKQFWRQRAKLLGRLVKYKFQPSGVKEKPRFPVFLGFRNITDL